MDAEEKKAQQERLHNENAVAFLENKQKLSYYTLSLSFAVLASAVASFRSPGHIGFVLLEIAGWLVLLAAGLAGLIGKAAEMEVARLGSLIHGATRPESQAQAEMQARRERRRIRQEVREEVAARWHWRLLFAGIAVFGLSRATYAVWETFCS